MPQEEPKQRQLSPAKDLEKRRMLLVRRKMAMFIHFLLSLHKGCLWIQIVVFQPLSSVQLFVTPWTAAHQASLSITNSQSLLKLMSIKLMMPSNHLILCHPLLFLPSIFPSIRAFFNESVLHLKWPKYWSFVFSISPAKKYSGLISFRTH